MNEHVERAHSNSTTERTLAARELGARWSGDMRTTPNEREALGIEYVGYVLAREKADKARKRYLRGQWFKRHGKGYKNRHVRRAGLAEARRERRREYRAELRAKKRERAASRKLLAFADRLERPGSSMLTALEQPAAKVIAKHAGDV